jgi:hypothetical protein
VTRAIARSRTARSSGRILANVSRVSDSLASRRSLRDPGVTWAWRLSVPSRVDHAA